MTYCVATRLQTGLVFLADSRTNAGVDHVSSFRKLAVFEKPGDRVLVLMSAGNLAITQSIRERLERGEAAHQIWQAKSLSEVAEAVGEAIRAVYRKDHEALSAHGIDFNCSFILGGQIQGEAPRLFQLYAAGNFIEAKTDGAYFQIGESKYGKPILDRVLVPELPLDDAVKCLLISMDSTLKSNLSVGPPLDLLVLQRDVLQVHQEVTLTDQDPYFQSIRKAWGGLLREAFKALPQPDWSVMQPATEEHVQSAPLAQQDPPAQLS